jgi:hypothetical protein
MINSGDKVYITNKALRKHYTLDSIIGWNITPVNHIDEEVIIDVVNCVIAINGIGDVLERCEQMGTLRVNFKYRLGPAVYAYEGWFEETGLRLA